MKMTTTDVRAAILTALFTIALTYISLILLGFRLKVELENRSSYETRDLNTSKMHCDVKNYVNL